MSEFESIVNALLIRVNKTDPVMLDILQILTDECIRLGLIVDPPPEVVTKLSGGVIIEPPAAPSGFIYQLTKKNVILSWESPSFFFTYYELREGTDWETASKILITANRQIVLNPISIGTHTYWLKTLDEEGLYSTVASRLDVVIPEIGLVTVIAEIVVNNIILRWNVPSSTFDIDHYIIRREGIELTKQDGLFFAYVESVQGQYTYSVTPVDIAGNVGPTKLINSDVSGFPDFTLHSVRNSTLTGTKVNSKVEETGKLLFNVNITETYQQHFSTRSWASPQAQINAGYPLWLSPFLTTGYYEEVFDFGTIFNNVMVTIDWFYQLIAGEFTFGLESRVSTDNINYSAPFLSSVFFVQVARYIKVKISFTSGNDKALLLLSKLTVSLSIKRETDSGAATAFASDANGTVVTFSKAFKDVDGITIAPMSTTTVIPIVIFYDVPNPTNFAVKIYDNAGVRKTVDFRWDARGVV